MKAYSLRRRLITATVLATGAALGLAACAFAVFDLISFRSALIDHLTVEARMLAANSTAALSFGDRKAAGELLGAFGAAPRIETAVLFDRKGEVFASYRRSDAPEAELLPFAFAEETRFTMASVSIMIPVALENEIVGGLYLRSDLREMYRTVLGHVVFISLAAGFSLLLAYVFLTRLQRSITSPVDRLVGLMQKVSRDKDYALRAAPAEIGEFDAIAAGLNEMLAMIQTRSAELGASNEQLVLELNAKKKAEAAIISAAHQWRTSFDAIGDCVCLLDPDGAVLRCNKSMADLLKKPVMEILERNINDLVYTPAKAEVSVGAGRIRALGGRETFTVAIGDRWFDVTIDPIRTEAGGTAGCVHIMTDTTERRTLQDHLAQANKMDAIGRLAGGVAHDFNNILSVIMSYGGFLLEEIPADSPLRSDVKEIKKSADRAAALTRQLLAFSRKQVVNPDILAVNDVINNLSKMLKRLIGEHIQMSLRFSADAGDVFMDPSQLEQIIVNIVVNARDAMPSGGGLVIETNRVVVAPEYPATFDDIQAGEYVAISIADTGVGMDKELVKKIFEPFFTTKEKGKGTGLGLSMVYGAVRQNSGAVKVYSEPGVGTTFRIYLKRHASDGGDKAAAAAVRTPKGGGELVLLVEDEEPVRRAVRRMLEGNGYRVVEAGNGKEGIAVFPERAADVAIVVSDVVMPGMGGIEMAKKLRELRPGLMVLHMSGYTDEILTDQGVTDDRTFILTKPFEQDMLLTKIREILDKG